MNFRDSSAGLLLPLESISGRTGDRMAQQGCGTCQLVCGLGLGEGRAVVPAGAHESQMGARPQLWLASVRTRCESCQVGCSTFWQAQDLGLKWAWKGDCRNAPASQRVPLVSMKAKARDGPCWARQ